MTERESINTPVKVILLMFKLKMLKVSYIALGLVFFIAFTVGIISVSVTTQAHTTKAIQVAGTVSTVFMLGGMFYSAPFMIGKVQDVLKNRNRLSVFNYVSSNPGCTPIEISVRQNMNKGTVKYHVFMLESQGKIILRRAGRYIRLFNSSNANSELDKTVLAYVKNDTSKSLLYAIMEEPGVTNKMLSEKFNLDKSSIHWHIERFINDRLVKFEQEGKNKKYFLEPDVIKLLTRSSNQAA